MQLEDIRTLGVVGAGAMGAGIAQVCLAAGYPVVLADNQPRQLEAAEGRIRKGLEIMEAKGRVASASDAVALLEIAHDLMRLHHADWIVEAIIEDEGAKTALFGTLGRITREETVLASNTSSISITRLGAASGRAERFVGMHFFNPPPLMALVEMIRGLRTAPDVFDTGCRLAEKLGKRPVEAGDQGGFIANRILMPFLNEAIRALQEGVGTPEAIDEVARLGFNHPMGPLQLADFIGLDVCLSIMQVLHAELGDPRFSPCPLLRKHVEAGWLGKKSGRGFYAY